jgi:hypothetical protein
VSEDGLDEQELARVVGRRARACETSGIVAVAAAAPVRARARARANMRGALCGARRARRRFTEATDAAADVSRGASIQGR